MKKAWGLIHRRQCWLPTFKGWLIVVVTWLLSIYILVHSVYGFLAVHQPMRSGILIVESWIPDFAVPQLLDEASGGDYGLVVISGGRELKGSYLSQYETTADRLSATVLKLGMDSTKIQIVRNPSTKRDRTYSSALCVKKWILDSNIKVSTVDIATIGPHARRSLILFKMALPKGLKVGIISLKDMDYDPDKWWNSSIGFKTVLSESIAYLYTKFFFYP